MSQHQRYETRSTANSRFKPATDVKQHAVHEPGKSVTIYIAIDSGTEFCKGAWKTIRDDATTKTDTSQRLRGVNLVTWSNASEYVKTQLSYTKDPGTDNYILRWGHEVDRAIRLGKLKHSSVIRYFKPAVFGEDINRNQKARTQIAKLPKQAREQILSQRLARCGQAQGSGDVEDIDFYLIFLRFAYWYILRCIAEDDLQLGWPVYTNLSRYKDWEPPSNVLIEVSLPLPAAATPESVQRVVAVAKAAGIPNPYPVAEPMAILAHYVHSASARPGNGKNLLIFDIGAGSADMQAWAMAEGRPLRVKELATSKTRWVGGRYVNRRCSLTVLKSIPQLKETLNTLRQKGSHLTIETLCQKIEDQFEQEKKIFDGTNELVLLVEELRHLPSSTLGGSGQIILQPQDVEGIYKFLVNTLVSMVDETCQEIRTRTTPGMPEVTFDKIVMAGGSSLSQYLRRVMRERYAPASVQHNGNPIPVEFPSEGATGSRTVAMGAILLLEDKNLITERIIRHGFCVAWAKPQAELPRRFIPPECFHTCKADGVRRVTVSKFFFQAGSSIPLQFEAQHVRGIRHLLMRDLDREISGWLIQEKLYYCEEASADDLAVEDEANKIREMSTGLEYIIPYDGAQQLWEHKEYGDEDFYEIEYEDVLYLDGGLMRLEIVIPRTGTFDCKNRDPDEDIRIKVEFTSTGLFDLVNRG